jgi:hypothetical protein
LARQLLWGLLTNAPEATNPQHVKGGESRLIRNILGTILGCPLTDVGNWEGRVHLEPPVGDREKEWFGECSRVLEKLLVQEEPGRSPDETRRSMDTLQRLVERTLTMSQPLFISAVDFERRVRDLIRVLEYDHAFTAVIDAATMPRMLSYASQPATDRIAECYVVPRSDPDHWNQRPPARWCPLSESVFAEYDRKERRQVQLLVVSPREGDYNTVGHVVDRLRNACEQHGVEIHDRLALGALSEYGRGSGSF